MGTTTVEQEVASTARIAYDIAEAARQVCLSDKTIRLAILSGALKARMLGRKYLIRHEDLCAWVNSLPPAEAQA